MGNGRTYSEAFQSRFAPSTPIQFEGGQDPEPVSRVISDPLEFFDRRPVPVMQPEVYKPERQAWMTAFSQTAREHDNDSLDQWVEYTGNLTDPVSGMPVTGEEIMGFVQQNALKYMPKKARQEYEARMAKRKFNAELSERDMREQEAADRGYALDKQGRRIVLDTDKFKDWNKELNDRLEVLVQIQKRRPGWVIARKKDSGLYKPVIDLVPIEDTQDFPGDDTRPPKEAKWVPFGPQEGQQAEVAPATSLSAEDMDALNWAKQNPYDPRAQKIRELLGQ